MFMANNCDYTMVNGLITPTGIVGKVKISTGTLSEVCKDAIIDVETGKTKVEDIKKYTLYIIK